MFNAHRVPVGRDQVQHIEMARDFAQRFNHVYGEHFAGGPVPFVLPEADIDASVATLPGLDGRKMSKSYDNTIPLWLEAPELRRALLGIVTDSRAPGEPKDPEASSVFAIYQAFASAEETRGMRASFAAGIAWGDAKKQLFERIDGELASARERYQQLMRRRDHVEDVLCAGARKARARGAPFMQALRAAVGLRPLGATAGFQVAGQSDGPPVAASAAARNSLQTAKAPMFKTWRERDGTFHFKVIDSEGAVLLTSVAFASAAAAGHVVAKLKRPAAALSGSAGTASLDGEAIGILAEDVSIDAVRAACAQLAA